MTTLKRKCVYCQNYQVEQVFRQTAQCNCVFWMMEQPPSTTQPFVATVRSDSSDE
jgi:hypothetical protein